MNLRPETQALLGAAYHCIGLLYAMTRHAGLARVGLSNVVIDEAAVRNAQSMLSAALEPFGRAELDKAIVSGDRFDAAWGGK